MDLIYALIVLIVVVILVFILLKVVFAVFGILPATDLTQHYHDITALWSMPGLQLNPVLRS